MNTRRQTKKRRLLKSKLRFNHTGEIIKTERELVVSDAEMEAAVIADKLAHGYHRSLEFYRRHCELSAEEARRYVDGDYDEKGAAIARERRVREASWHDISVLANADMKEGLELWERVRIAALEDLNTGAYLQKAVDNSTPQEHAHLYALRDSFIEGWQPRNGIESAMIDMLVETFILFQYWTTIAHSRAVYDHDRQEKDLKRWEEKKWKSPYQSEANATDQAHRLADSYNRMFLRTLRQMRDLRRYPVVIKNPSQVNVGNQQVNVAQQ